MPVPLVVRFFDFRSIRKFQVLFINGYVQIRNAGHGCSTTTQLDFGPAIIINR